MEREEGFPPGVGDAGEVAKLGVEVGVFLQQVRLGLKVIGDGAGIRGRSRLRTHKMNHRRTAADLVVQLLDEEVLALLAEVFLNFYLAINGGEVVP
jgi:hypothetical protein